MCRESNTRNRNGRNKKQDEQKLHNIRCVFHKHFFKVSHHLDLRKKVKVTKANMKIVPSKNPVECKGNSHPTVNIVPQ